MFYSFYNKAAVLVDIDFGIGPVCNTVTDDIVTV